MIIPSNKMSAHNPYGYILIESCTLNANPMFLFYYEEHIFGLAAHYQSVMPVGQCPILKHYMWTKTTEKSIRLSSSSSIFSSTKIDSNHKKRKNCEDSSTLSKKRKNSQGCHICTLSFSNGVKKNAIVENIATKPVLANALMFKVFSLWHEHFVICFMYATLDISNISLLSWTFHNMFYVCNNKYI